MKNKILKLAAALLLTGPMAANATPITWQLSDGEFDDGGTFNGEFTTDNTTGALLSYDIVTTVGSLINGYHYNGNGDAKLDDNIFAPNSFVIANLDPFAIPFFSIAFVNPLTSSHMQDNAILIGLTQQTSSFEGCNAGCGNGRFVTGGIVTSVPEPGTLALLGLGLAGMGIARRRKAA